MANKIKSWLDEQIWIDDGRKGATFNHWFIGPRWLLISYCVIAVVLVGGLWWVVS